MNPDWIHEPAIDTPKAIEWDHVSMDFAGRQVLSDVSTWVHATELTCLCGANGAGKTQLLRMGLGFLAPRSGQVRLLGAPPLKTRRRVGYVPQLKSFNRGFPATVEDVLVASMRGSWPLWSRRSERDDAAHALQTVDALPLLDKDLSVLSGGELQRVFVARALLGQPEVLVLDEPMAAVDSSGRATMLELLRRLKMTKQVAIVLITHSDAIVSELADRVIFLEKGRLVAWGSPDQVLDIDELKNVAFFGHDHEAAIDDGEG